MSNQEKFIEINGRIYKAVDDIELNLKTLNQLNGCINDMYKDIYVFNRCRKIDFDEVEETVNRLESAIIVFEDICNVIDEEVYTKRFKKRYYKKNPIYYWYKHSSTKRASEVWCFIAKVRKEIIKNIKENQNYEEKVQSNQENGNHNS